MLRTEWHFDIFYIFIVFFIVNLSVKPEYVTENKNKKNKQKMQFEVDFP